MRVVWESADTSIATADQQDADELAGFHQRARGAFAQGAQGKWYELTKPFFNPSSVRDIDNLLAQPG